MERRTITCLVEVESNAPLGELKSKKNWEFWSPQYESKIKRVVVDVVDATKTHRRTAK